MQEPHARAESRLSSLQGQDASPLPQEGGSPAREGSAVPQTGKHKGTRNTRAQHRCLPAAHLRYKTRVRPSHKQKLGVLSATPEEEHVQGGTARQSQCPSLPPSTAAPKAGRTRLWHRRSSTDGIGREQRWEAEEALPSRILHLPGPCRAPCPAAASPAQHACGHGQQRHRGMRCPRAQLPSTLLPSPNEHKKKINSFTLDRNTMAERA